jgi:hypothetical protein
MREGGRVQQWEREREGKGKGEKGKGADKGGQEGLLFTFQAFFWGLLFLPYFSPFYVFVMFILVLHLISGPCRPQLYNPLL